MRYVVLVLVLVLAGCDRAKTAPSSATARKEGAPATAASPPVAPEIRQSRPPPPAPPAPEAFATTSYPTTMKGQLDRVDFEAAIPRDESSWLVHDVDALRKISGWKGRTDPRLLSQLAYVAAQQAKDQGPVTYPMLKKNAARYAGRAYVTTGRIIEISEAGGVTVARITDGQSDRPLFVVARFLTDFVEGNRVEVYGLLAGDYSYKSRAGWDITIPALAAMGLLKPGSGDGFERQFEREERQRKAALRPARKKVAAGATSEEPGTTTAAAAPAAPVEAAPAKSGALLEPY